MQAHDIKGKNFHRYRRHRAQHHFADNSHNLLRQREHVDSINQVWVGDITFIRVAEEWS